MRRRFVPQSGPVQVDDLATQRHPDHTRAAKRCPRESDADCRSAPGTEHVRKTRPRIRLVHDERGARPARRDVGRSGCVASEADDDRNIPVADDLPHVPDSPPKACGKADGRTIRSARERQAFDRQQLIAPVRHEARFEPLLRPQHDDLHLGIAGPKSVRDRQQRIDMACGSPAGQKIGRHAATLPRRAALAPPRIPVRAF